MAKELDILESDTLFTTSFESFRVEGARISQSVLAEVGGYEGVAAKFPFDRGKANHALVLYCLEAAQSTANPDVADRLRSAAIMAASSVTYAGSKKHPDHLDSVIKSVGALVQQGGGQMAESPLFGDNALSTNIGQIIFNINNRDVDNSVHRSSNNHTVYDLRWKQISGSTDLTELSKQLRQVQEKLTVGELTQEIQQAEIAIGGAQEAIALKDGSKLIQALCKGGTVILDAAKDVGADVLAKIIIHAMGGPTGS
jgi:hypothetical protein